MKKLITLAFAGFMAIAMSGAYAQDSMKKDGMMKKDAMSHDGMKK